MAHQIDQFCVSQWRTPDALKAEHNGGYARLHHGPSTQVVTPLATIGLPSFLGSHGTVGYAVARNCEGGTDGGNGGPASECFPAL
jgi:hypothetical protein